MTRTSSKMSTEVVEAPQEALAMTPDRAIRVEDDADFRDIQELSALHGAIAFPGANMVPKMHLLGIPLVIVGVRFQNTMRTENGERDYLTVDAFVADLPTVQDAIDKGRVLKSVGRDAEPYTDVDDLPVSPEERILFNDGSTGVRRQFVELLNRLDLIDVGAVQDRRDFDTAWTQWADPFKARDKVACSWFAADGTEIPAFRSFADGRPLIVAAPRGLTGSVYANEYAPSGWATTYYVR